jgi:hypothetical protein
MSFTFESLIIAIIAVLPGFIGAAVRATLKPGDSPSAGEWVAGSIVSSLALNALAFFLYIFFVGGIDLNRPIVELQTQFGALAARSALGYVGLLYALALIWGLVSGLSDERFTLRVLAYRLRLTPISPTPSVFIDVLERLVGSKENRRLRDHPAQQVAWLRVQRDDKIIQGRLRKSSVRFAVSEPIEVYLAPAYIFEAGVIIDRDDGIPDADTSRDLYLRIRPEDIVEILVAPASWRPVAPHSSQAQTPAAPWWRRVAFFAFRKPKPQPAPASRQDRPVDRKQLALPGPASARK